MKKILITTLLSFAFCFGFSQARTLLGPDGEQIPDTLRQLYIDSPFYKIGDTLKLGDVGSESWRVSAPHTIYHDSGTVTIYNDTAQVTDGSSALVLQNRTPATSTATIQSAPALSIIGNTWYTSGTSRSVPIEWRLVPTGAVGTAGSISLVPYVNGVKGAVPFTLSNGLLTASSITSSAGTYTSSLSSVDLTLTRKIVGTYALGNGVTSDAQWLDISPTSTYSLTTGYRTYRGIYYHPVLTTTIGAGMVAFENTLAENRFNSAGGRTGVGVPDSVNKSAKFEIRDSTKGILIPRMTKVQRNKIISSLKGTISNGGSGYFNANRGSISLTGGSGTGATADIIVSGNIVTTVWIRDIGSGYVVGDVLSATIPGGGSGFTYTITEANPPADGLLVEVTGETGGTYLSQYNASTSGWVKFTTTSD